MLDEPYYLHLYALIQHYPTFYRPFILQKFKIVDTCALAQIIILNELMDSDDEKPHRGKTRRWVKRRSDQGYFNNITGFKLAVCNSEFAKRFGRL